ncbi:MAG: hypothetical protein NC210_08235 [[Clostridium] fimetarium]|nr:hypothetical protein [Alistipes timonensis]MCM1406393.1 hypothetical protein [[Clostridium] fimetarium]
MKKALFLPFIALSVTTAASAEVTDAGSANDSTVIAEYDASNIPVFLVDGIEVLDTDSLPRPEEIESIKIIKDSAIINIFSPRLGGVVLITTKSKDKLNEVLQKAAATDELRRLSRDPGTLLIR